MEITCSVELSSEEYTHSSNWEEALLIKLSQKLQENLNTGIFESASFRAIAFHRDEANSKKRIGLDIQYLLADPPAQDNTLPTYVIRTYYLVPASKLDMYPNAANYRDMGGFLTDILLSQVPVAIDINLKTAAVVLPINFLENLVFSATAAKGNYKGRETCVNEQKSPNKSSRADVYKTIDEEREYQEQIVLTDPTRSAQKDHSVGDYLTLLAAYLRKAQDAYTTSAGNCATLKEIRKIAALAVRSMEEHGAVPRYPDLLVPDTDDD